MAPTVKTLAVGAAGAAAAVLLSLPLAPLLGALAAVLLAGRFAGPFQVSAKTRGVALMAAGVFLGSRFPSDLAHRAAEWPLTMLAVLAYVAIAVLLAAAYLRLAARYDLPTAIFSAVPGGILTMMALGERTGGRVDTIMLNQSLRVVFAVVLLPLALVDANAQSPSFYGSFTPRDWLLVLTAAPAAALLGRRVNFPAAEVLGPMFTIAALFNLGWLSGEAPALMFLIALWVVGSALGAQFPALSLAALRSLLLHGFAVFAALAGLALACAALLAPLSAEPLSNLFLAFAPGGIAEIAAISIALGNDPAFVTVHHAVRIIFCSAAAPLIARTLTRKETAPS
jgi:hypothetical protein